MTLLECKFLIISFVDGTRLEPTAPWDTLAVGNCNHAYSRVRGGLVIETRKDAIGVNSIYQNLDFKRLTPISMNHSVAI